MKSFIKVIVLTLFLFMNLNAGVIHVPWDQPSIQAGINAAVTGDTVLVVDSTYYENINFKGKAITVASLFIMDGDTNHINNTVIDGSQPINPDSASVVTFVSGEDTNSVLNGFTITGGSGTYDAQWQARDGGGIFCQNSGCKIVKNKIMNNAVNDVYASGGGFAAYADSPIPSVAYVILESNEFTDNTVTAGTGSANGGGIAIYCNGEIIDNIISNNECFSDANLAAGGGLDCWSDNTLNPPHLIIKSNNISHNSGISNASSLGFPEAQGGGMRIRGYHVLMQGNQITYNTLNSLNGTSGGGIRMVGSNNSSVMDGNIIKYNTSIRTAGGIGIHTSDPFMINNIVAENSGAIGGGILFYQSNPKEFIHNTIFNNQATSSGGGVHIWYTNLKAMNNILWGNHAPVDSQIHIHTGGNLQAVYCDIQGGWTGVGNIDADPLFADDSLHLSDNSPCIDSGIDSFQIGGVWYFCSAFDYEWDLRPHPGTGPDIGVDETQIIMGIEKHLAIDIPRSYSLYQNYPNPFNPSTTIEFALPKPSEVTLKIFNILGKEVTTLVSERLFFGSYAYNWEARNLASGIYLYRLQAGDYVETRKMVLMK